MVSSSLDVYLLERRVGTLRPAPEGRCAFAYSAEALEAGAGMPPLSHSLPLRERPYGPLEATRYFERLLPSGERRIRIAAELGIGPRETFALLAELGRDCPGAVVLVEEGEPIEPPPPDSLSYVTDAELEFLLSPEPWGTLFDPGDRRRMRQALPGAEHGVALYRDEQRDRWAWPEPGLPSTHVLRAEPPERPGLAAITVAFTNAYRKLGMPSAQVQVAPIGERVCLVGKRFDRWFQEGRIHRLHQESFAQAIGLRQGEEASLAESCELVREIGEEGAVETLKAAAFSNRIVGNCTQLAASCALLYEGSSPMVAPLQRISATELYGDTYPIPPPIGGPPAPFLCDLARVIAECRHEFQPSLIAALSLMVPICAAVGEAAERAVQEGWYDRAIDEALAIVFRRVKRFPEELEYLRPPGSDPIFG